MIEFQTKLLGNQNRSRQQLTRRPQPAQLRGDLALLEVVGVVKPITLHHDEMLKQLREDAATAATQLDGEAQAQASQEAELMYPRGSNA